MKGRSGFSILEVLIAMAVLVIGVLAVLGTFPSLLDLSQRSWGNIQATALAEDKMQQILAGIYGNPMSTDCSQYSDKGNSPNYHANYHAFKNVTRSWCAQPAPPDQGGNLFSNVQLVDVQVAWTDEKNQLHTVIVYGYLTH